MYNIASAATCRTLAIVLSLPLLGCGEYITLQFIRALFAKIKHFRERLHHNLENSTCDPLKYKTGNPILIVSICMGQMVKS